MSSDQAELADLDTLKELADFFERLPKRLELAVAEVEDDIRPRLKRIERALSQAQEDCEVARRAYRNASEDEEDDAKREYDEARERVSELEYVVQDVRSSLRSYKLAAREISELRIGLIAGASAYLRGKILSAANYLSINPLEGNSGNATNRAEVTTKESATPLSQFDEKSKFASLTSSNIAKSLTQAGLFRADFKSLQEEREWLGRYVLLGNIGPKNHQNFPEGSISYNRQNVPIRELYIKSREAFEALSFEVQTAVRAFHREHYWKINASLSKGDAKDRLALLASQGIAEASIALPEGLVLSRKFDFPINSEADEERLLRSVGKVFADMGIISTSLDPKVWNGNLHAKIIVEKGARGLFVANGDSGEPAISKHARENEVTLPFASQFYIKKVVLGSDAKHTDQDGTWADDSKIFVEMILLQHNTKESSDESR